MDDGYNGPYSLIYDGSSSPYILTFTATNLTSGLPYNFKVAALNINGQSAFSASVTMYACLVPSNVISPYKIATTKTSVTLGWY